ncbi:MAG: histidinol-phosphate transaminase [Bacillota bacterium]|nr:histidinol-phosphate transaminase [Bacillota bacterium]HHU60365.1 histidinol-phosphate transaminase [Natronincola sp.]
MSRFLSSQLANLEPYVPGEQPQERKYIKLNTNEYPYPPSPKVRDILDTKEIDDLRLYPDPQTRGLVTAMSEYYGLREEQILLGNGSDEILAFFFMAFCDQKRKIGFPDISYGFYPVYASLFGIDALKIPLREDFSINAEDYFNLDRNIVIANPNAPTGLYLELEDIERIAQTNPDHVVLIDEAYIDFGGASALTLLPKYENLLVCGTFSKSRALAGARIGFAFGSPDLIEDLNKIKFSFNPYNINRLSLLAGVASIEDNHYFESHLAKIIETREETSRALRELDFYVTDSKTNFLFAKHEKMAGEDLYLKLKDQGILVRHFNQERISDYLRITIGTPEEMDEFLETMTAIIRGDLT